MLWSTNEIECPRVWYYFACSAFLILHLTFLALSLILLFLSFCQSRDKKMFVLTSRTITAQWNEKHFQPVSNASNVSLHIFNVSLLNVCEEKNIFKTWNLDESIVVIVVVFQRWDAEFVPFKEMTSVEVIPCFFGVAGSEPWMLSFVTVESFLSF